MADAVCTPPSAAVRLARLLGPDECALIGGLAVGVHGYVRATDDLDFISRQPLGVTRERLQDAGTKTRLRRGGVLDGGFSCLKGEMDGIPFDVLPPLVPITWDGALVLDIAGGTLKVVDPRIRAQAREEAEIERRRAKKAPRAAAGTKAGGRRPTRRAPRRR